MAAKRLLVLPRYARSGASSRLRMWQYLPFLERSGFEIEVRPLFDDAYVTELQHGRRHTGQVIAALARRVRDVSSARHADLVWIEKEMLPFVPFAIERRLWPSRVPVVVDYDDAVYLLYAGHRSGAVRRLLSGKHRELMRRADLVVAGNPVIAAYAEAAGAQRVEVVPTVVDLDRYPVRTANDAAGTPMAVWIGQRATGDFLKPLAPVMRELSAAGVLDFTAIGVDAAASALPMRSLDWNEADEASAIAACDIGIMPLPDTPFEQGKCGYKLIQYMACGLPVVASPVGVNRDIVEHGVNGFLASTPGEWDAALRRLAGDANLRGSMGAAGRSKVEREYSLTVAKRRLASIFECPKTR